MGHEHLSRGGRVAVPETDASLDGTGSDPRASKGEGGHQTWSELRSGRSPEGWCVGWSQVRVKAGPGPGPGPEQLTLRGEAASECVVSSLRGSWGLGEGAVECEVQLG